MLRYNVKGEKRKAMVKIIGDATGIKPVYTRVPECAYQIGKLKVTRTSDLIWEDGTEDELIWTVKEKLKEAGFLTEENVEATDTSDPEEDTETGEDNQLIVSMPRSYFTDQALENLRKIVASKQTLLKKALGAEDLHILISDDKVSFPWFPMASDAEAHAFTHLIVAICRMAKEAKRVTAKEKETESEKYTFRCWLLRLGFNGPEHKHDRAILMQNLSGSAAFKNSQQAKDFARRQKEKKKA